MTLPSEKARQILRSWSKLSDKTVITNAAALTFTSAVASLFAYLIGLHAATTLGPAALGQFYWVTFIVSYAVFASSPGVGTVGQREVAKHPKIANRVFSSILSLQMCMSAALFSATVALTLWLVRDPTTSSLFLVNSIVILLAGSNALWLLQATQRMTAPAFFALACDVVIYPVILIFVRNEADLVLFAWLCILPQIGKYAFYLAYVHQTKTARFSKIRFSTRGWKQYFLTSFPFAISAMAVLIYYNSDAIIIGVFRGEEDVGQYGAAYALMLLLCTPCFSLLRAYYPVLSAARKEGGPDAPRIRSQEFQSKLAWVGLPLTALSLALGQQAFLALYGEQYLAASTYFAVLCSNIALIYVNVGIANPLTAWGFQRLHMCITLGSAAINIVLNFLLIPPFGAFGAIAGTLLAECFVLVATCVVRQRRDIYPYAFLRALSHPALCATGIFIMLAPMGIISSAALEIRLVAMSVGAIMVLYPIGKAWIARSRVLQSQ